MNDRVFGAPIFVRGGQHLIQEIASLDDALDFLDEWPVAQQGPIYAIALRACHRAYSREVPLDVAREAFTGFAKSAGVHEQVDNFPAPPAIPTSGHGGVPP